VRQTADIVDHQHHFHESDITPFRIPVQADAVYPSAEHDIHRIASNRDRANSDKTSLARHITCKNSQTKDSQR
jgi:hypothetical protein